MERVQTIQQTSKWWKLCIVLGKLGQVLGVFAAGIGWVCISGSTTESGRAMSVAVLVAGIVVVAVSTLSLWVTKFLTWWFHG